MFVVRWAEVELSSRGRLLEDKGEYPGTPGRNKKGSKKRVSCSLVQSARERAVIYDLE